MGMASSPFLLSVTLLHCISIVKDGADQQQIVISIDPENLPLRGQYKKKARLNKKILTRVRKVW